MTIGHVTHTIAQWMEGGQITLIGQSAMSRVVVGTKHEIDRVQTLSRRMEGKFV